MKKLYGHLLCIVVPAAVLAAAGIYTIIQEGRLSREAERTALQEKAGKAASFVASRVKGVFERHFLKFEKAEKNRLTDVMKNTVAEDPFVYSGYLWKYDPETSRRTRGHIVWSSRDAPNDEFFSRRQKRLEEFESAQIGKLNWSRQEGRDGGRVACWMKISTNEVCLLELEKVAVLARIPGWMEKCGVDRPDLEGRDGLAAEVRGISDEILCPSSIKLVGSSFGEESLDEICIPEWKIRVAWSEGDAFVSGNIFRMMVGAGSLLALCIVCFVVGFMMFVKSAVAAQRDALQKTTFVDNVSHELKTPLTAIRLYTDMLTGGKLSSHERREHALEVISSETGRLLRMVDNLLDFGRLERGRRIFKPETTDIAGFVASTVDMVRGKFVENGIVFEAEKDVYADVDRDALRQILLNILENAAKYAASSGTVKVSVGRDGDGNVDVAVEDGGPGLDEHARSRVFDRFWRGDDSITSETSGSGLGLSIARHLAEGMDGTLDVSPSPAGGCRFSFKIKEVLNGEDSCC